MSWETVELSKVAEINPRFQARGQNLDQIVSFVPMASVSEQTLTIEDEQEKKLGDVIKGYTSFQNEDVIIAKITPCFENGKLALVDLKHEIGFGSTEFHVLRPQTSRLDPRFLYHFVQQKEIRFIGEKRMTGSAGQKRVPKVFWEDLKIPLPPLGEQRRIAAVLDKADALRQKRRAALAKLDTLLQATFLHMFGDPVTNPMRWEETELGNIAKSFQNGIGKNKEHYGSGEKVANIGDLYNWHTFSPAKYSLLQVNYKEIKKYTLKRGDLLFVRSSVKREGVAYCSMYSSDEPCLFSSFMIRAKIDNSLIEPEFLSFMLRTPPLRLRLINASNTGTITNISQTGLTSVRFFIPPVERQREFISKIRLVEKQNERQKMHLLCLDNLFHALQQRAFNGQL